jgi:hypothetical protein
MNRDQIDHAYRGEVKRQCRHALKAFDDLNRALGRFGEWPFDEHSHPMIDVWAAVQSFLVAATNVSKLFWSPGESKGRRKHYPCAALRASFGVEDSSIFRADGPLRGVRNGFEHFDEWLDQWAGSVESFVDCNVGPWETVPNPGDVQRHLDQVTLTVSIQGVSVELRPVVEALRELLATEPSS